MKRYGWIVPAIQVGDERLDEKVLTVEAHDEASARIAAYKARTIEILGQEDPTWNNYRLEAFLKKPPCLVEPV